MSEYGVQSARRSYGNSELNNSDRLGRRKRILEEPKSPRLQDFNGQKTAENDLSGLKEDEDKYYQYLLRKSSSNRRSATEETLSAANGNVGRTVSRSDRFSFSRANNFQEKPLSPHGEKQINRESSSCRGNVYRGNLSGPQLVNRDRQPNSLSASSQSHAQGDRPDRRPRVKDLRSLFDSGPVKDDHKAEVRSHVSKNANYIDQAASRTSNTVNKETIKTNDALGKSSELSTSSGGGRKSSLNGDGERDGKNWSQDIVPTERARVFSGSRKTFPSGDLHSTDTSHKNSQNGITSKTGIKLSQEEARGAWRLSLAAYKPRDKDSSSEHESDSSSDSQDESQMNLDNSRQRISDRQVIKMLQKRHPTEELKKMFDGPEAFDATTKRQSFHELHQKDVSYETERSKISPHDDLRISSDGPVSSSEVSPVRSDVPENVYDKYIDSAPEGDGNFVAKGNIDVSQFIASPSPPKISEGNTKSDHGHNDDEPHDQSTSQADSYKSMYHEFLKKEGVETAGTPSPPKTTYRYTRETYRPPLYSEDSEADSEILGESKIQKEDFVESTTDIPKPLESLPEPTRQDSIESSSVDDLDHLMPKDYEGQVHDDFVRDSSSQFDDSDVNMSPEVKSNFGFNFVLKHQNDLEGTGDEDDSKSKVKSKQGVRFTEKPHTVHETYHPLDYERGNDDIDPVSSSAEWELEKRVEKMDIFSVDLDKGDQRGLGLSIVGLGVGTDSGVEKLGIFVKSLTVGGAAEADGRIQVNDQILEVDGISLVGVSQLFAAQTLKNTKGTVRFLMGREKSQHVNKVDAGKYMARCEQLEKELILAKERMREVEAEQLVNKVTANGDSDGSNAEKDLRQQLYELQEKLKMSEESLGVAEREHKALLEQLSESKKLYTMVQRKNTLLKEQLARNSPQYTGEVNDSSRASEQTIQQLQARIRELETALRSSGLGDVQSRIPSNRDDSSIFDQYIQPTEPRNELELSGQSFSQDEIDFDDIVKATPAITVSELNEVVPTTQRLDHTMQLDKRHVGVELKRQRPTRDHIHRLSRDLDPEQEAEIMNKSVEDLVEKVREYAEDPSLDAKPRRPQTSYYADSPGVESSSHIRPLHLTVNDRGRGEKGSLKERNSLPRMKTRSNESLSERSRSLEDVSSSSRDNLTQESSSNPALVRKNNELLPESADERSLVSPTSSTGEGLSDHGTNNSEFLSDESGGKPIMVEWKNIPLVEWDSRQASCWLMSIQLEEYSDVFIKNNIDGNELLSLDSARIKALGVQQKHQKVLKKRLKELRNEMGKQEKQRLKNRKGSQKSKKVPFWKGKYSVSSNQ